MSAVVAVSLIHGLGVHGLSAPAFAAPARFDLAACDTNDEQAFRSAIVQITLSALQSGLSDVDYKAAVAEEWRRAGLDTIIDTRVDLAIDEVRKETSWGSLIQSLGSQEKAKELATAVAERVYRSDAVKAAIEGLAVGVGQEIGRRMEAGSGDAADPTLQCLKGFVGSRYGATVAAVVTGDAGRELSADAQAGTAGVAPGSVLSQSTEGITGAVILVMRRQLANMAGRVGARLVGSVLSRLVSVVAGGVGLVLIAKDVWELRNGVLPIIASEMKSPENKGKVQEELATTIATEIGTHIKEIAAKSADRVLEIWHEFRRAHAKALQLAETAPKFKAFIETIEPTQIARLDEVTAMVLAAEGEAGVLKRVDDGTFADAVSRMPAPAMDIAREMRAIDTGLGWWTLAGDRLGKVIEYDLYRRAAPTELSMPSLDRVLALDDRLAAQRLVSVDRATRDALLDLPATDLKNLARSLTESELTTLARYLTGLEPAARDAVLRAVASTPGKMQVIASQRVRDGILASRDQSAAVEMMLRGSAMLDVPNAIADLTRAWEGDISPVLIWERHPAVVALAGLALLILLLLLRRLFAPRRRHPPAPQQT